MNEWHPDELELAQASAARRDGELMDHLRWCAPCRAVAADYDWLDREIPAALDAGLQQVPLPQPNWDGLSARLGLHRQRAVRGQLLAVAGAVMIACLMLVAPSLLSPDLPAAGMLAPDVAVLRMPTAYEPAAAPSARPSSTVPAVAPHASDHRSVSLPFVPPPEPPQPGA